MSDISKIDKNFKVETKLDIEDIKFYDVLEEPFKVYGVFYENGKFRRLPEEVAKTVNDGVYGLHAHTAGGRVRFKTDSSYIAINAKMPSVGKMPHFAVSGSAGFDLYVKGEMQIYKKTFMPPFNFEGGYESIIELGSREMREITINFPTYSEVSNLYIGLSETAGILEPTPYKYEKPIVYYGSSITQGGCCSRPGNTYEATISRRFDIDHINLGFSGSARAEDSIAEYIKDLDMSIFVYDYDHNAPTLEHLKATHKRMYDIIRKANPDLPIIIMTKPTFFPDVYSYAVIKETYEIAKANGDNVYYLDGPMLMAMAGNEGTVDNCHPNDLGFASMAKAVGDVIEGILK